MAGEYEKPITIKQAIDSINSRELLLPAIQRKFVWSTRQICVLFDSILRGYPINTCMFWEVKNSHIKQGYKFYEFLNAYCQRFKEENPHYITNASSKDFNAVIDGQQRLTSLYIGLCSTYAYKQPRVWWPSTQDNKVLPPRKLYLDLKRPVDREQDDSLMYYNFRFLTERQYEEARSDPAAAHHWFCMHDVLNMAEKSSSDDILMDIVLPELEKRNLLDNDFARKTLLKVYNTIRIQKIIHYFKETSQEIDHVLDVFIRTNSGGTKLDFADLLMSIAVANWDGDFRQEIDSLIKYIHQNVNMGFYIERDWILKTCLMLTDTDVRFKVQNFKSEQVAIIQDQWSSIQECIKATFILIKSFGINPQSLTSKNAVIPICYYLYKHIFNEKPLYNVINNPAKVDNQRAKISQWLYMVLLKGIFGGQADSILTSMREVLRSNINEPEFPLDAIIERYKATNKDLRFDDDYIESMLNIQYGERRCRALLHLLFPEMDPNRIYHIDHLHPKSEFDKKALKKHSFLSVDSKLFDFYKDSAHWNSIANLHLLNDSQNASKGTRSLNEWFNDPSIHITRGDLLADDVSFEFSDFEDFYQIRRANLKQRLISRVYVAKSMLEETPAEDSDEEIFEEEIL
ncbi:DUF262 domain-containing protein [Cardiobacteriaceae bacterium TAE3-ERU3]|nr:DUF262 domain-containing protein [Cardiobacteriaceae bacterium TAE3-ERU3]